MRKQLSQKDINHTIILAIDEIIRELKRLDVEIRKAKRTINRRFQLVAACLGGEGLWGLARKSARRLTSAANPRGRGFRDLPREVASVGDVVPGFSNHVRGRVLAPS
jgi:hypothetical protein